MKYVVVWCALSTLAWFGCTVSADSPLQTEESDALLTAVAYTVCTPNVLQAAERAAQQNTFSEPDATALANELPAGYQIESAYINGEFSSVESPVDPEIELKILDANLNSFWANVVFSRPRVTGMTNPITRMFLQDKLSDDVGRECTPERNAGGIIVDAVVSEEIDVDEHRERLCLERNEATDPVILNGAQPLTDNPNGPRSVRVPGSMSDSEDADEFSINIRDEFWKIPIDGKAPRVVIQVTPDDTSQSTAVSGITARIDCGDKTPRMICADGVIGASCHSENSSMEIEIACFYFSGDARLDLELVAAPWVTACVPYQLSVTVQ